VQYIALDSRGICWINTKGGLAYYDGEFITEQKTKDGKSFARGSIVLPAGHSIIFDSGTQLIKNNGSSLDTIYSDTYPNFKKRVIFHKDELYLIAHNKEKLLRLNLDGAILDSIDLETKWSHIGIDKGVIYIVDKYSTEKISRVRILQNSELIKVYETKNNLYMGPNTPDLCFIESTKSSVNPKHFSILNHKNDFEAAVNIDRSKNRSDCIKIVNTLPHDLWWIHNNSLFKISDTLIKEYAISNLTHTFVVEDRDQNIIVSNEHGLAVFLNHDFTTYPLDLCSDVWTMHRQKDKIYTSHFSEGLFELDLEKHTKKYIPFNHQRFSMYFGSSKSEDFLFFPGARGFTTIKDGIRKDYYDRYKIPTLLTSYYDSDDKLFYGGGLNSILTFDQRTKTYNIVNDTSKIGHGYIVEIKPKSDYEKWCGYWKGLKIYNKEENRFIDMNHIFPSGIKASASSIAYDHNERLWVGGSSGLFFKAPDVDTLTFFSTVFSDKQILDIEFIPSRKILAVGTNSEIYFINLDENRAQMTIKEFNYKNGFLGEEIAQNGFYLDGNNLWIPSATHLSKIDISKISLETPFSDIFIKTINDQWLPYDPSAKEAILIEKGKNNFQINYGSMGTGLPLKRMYQYKLVGYDDQWSDWTNDEKVSYQNLGSGEYQFLLRGQKSNGVEIAENNTKIVIDLPLHKEPNFYKFALLGLFLFFVASLAYFYFYRRLSIKNKEKELTNNYLKVKGLQSQMNPHFIFNVLGSIQSLMLNGKIEEADKYLIAFSKLIRRFLDSSILDSYSSDNIVSGIKETTLTDEIELLEIYTRFEELQLDNKFSTQMDIGPNINTDLETIPPMIIQPFVENAIKHGLSNLEGKGLLKIRFLMSDDVIKCIVDDNGIGREKAEALKKNKKYYHRSLGNDLVFDRIDILNKIGYQIAYNIIDTTKGTQVELEFSKKLHS